MVIFPLNYVQLSEYPGYYWNIQTRKLYSCKSGELKELTLVREFRYPGRHGTVTLPAGYSISVKGQRHRLSRVWLETVQLPTDCQTFPEAQHV